MPYSESDAISRAPRQSDPARWLEQLVEDSEATHGHRRLKHHGAERNPLRVAPGLDGRFFGGLFMRDHGREQLPDHMRLSRFGAAAYARLSNTSK